MSRLMIALSICTWTLLAPAAHADESSLNLESVLAKVGSSPRMQKSASMSEEARWKKNEALSTLLPTVTLGASRLLDKKYLLTDVTLPGGSAPVTIPQILPTTTYSLGAQWTLFDGLANIDRYRASGDFESAARTEHNWAQFQTSREAVLLFYKALAAETLKSVAEQNVKTLEEHLRDVELFRKSGLSTKYDVLRVDVQASEAKSELLNATDSVTVSRLRLGELLGSTVQETKIEGTLPALNNDAIANLKLDADQAITNRGDLSAASQRIDASRKLESAAGKYWIPKVSFAAQYQNYNNKDDTYAQDQFRDAYTVGLQAAWTFDGVIGPYARDRQASEQRFQAEKTLEMGKIKAANDLEFWKRRFLYFCNVFKARQGDIGKADESVRLAKEGRRAGVRTNTDLLDAELELFRAKAGLVNAQMGAIESLINLELASGQELHKF